MLKVSPWKGIFRFGKRGKLSPRFVGPFKILERVGSVAYRLELPLELSNIHDVFHISNLKKCLTDESLIVPLEEIHIDEKLQFSEEPVEVMDREMKVSHPQIPTRGVCPRGCDVSRITAQEMHADPNARPLKCAFLLSIAR
ncbi:hypothetical protein E3N88_11790 [Mikania micrantha]|uniref:Tf2-1-like SH3-like domain-containing protein n=1 Tax=Mikania micrantha TaxID=192012 RepID=A0A5N6P5G9_9ASTR|nr:hypothetical protein E3N88_11790 [Mikania micrantha]